MASKATLLSKLAFQIRRGFHEIPEVMSAGVIGTASMFGSLWIVFTWPEPEMSRRFKRDFFVLRPDDPRLESVRRFENSPEVTSY